MTMINTSDKIIKAEHVRVVGPGRNRIIPSGRVDGSITIEGGSVGRREEGLSNEPGGGLSQAAIDELKKEEYDSGYAAGITEGREMARKELAAAFTALERAAEEVKGGMSDLWRKAEQHMVRLAVMIAEKIIHREVSVDRTVVIDVIRNAAAAVQDKNGMTIRLNPRDYDYIAEANADFLSYQGLAESFMLERDDRIKPGGAVIESKHTEVDARLDGQLQAILEALNVPEGR
jgi:flagellar assembly protein FliH